MVKKICKIFSYMYVSIFPEIFIIETTYLCNLSPPLMISLNNGDTFTDKESQELQAE